MSKFGDWFDKNERRVWLFVGVVLLSVAVHKPPLASAIWFIGLALMPMEDSNNAE